MANYVYNTARTPGRAARAVTQRSSSYSGKGVLTGELLAGFLIILIRIVADFSVQGDGSIKGNVLHPQGQFGPLPIAAGLIGSFFFLSFVAMGGGTRAKLAVILGGAIITTLAMKSTAEIGKISTVLGTIGTAVVPPPSGTEESGAVVYPLGSSTTASSSPATGSSSASTANTSSSANASSSNQTAENNAAGATLRQADSLLTNFPSDFVNSFNLANPGGVVKATSQQWNTFQKLVGDTAVTAGDTVVQGGKEIINFFKGL
jgi:hypothetical protein